MGTVVSPTKKILSLSRAVVSITGLGLLMAAQRSPARWNIYIGFMYRGYIGIIWGVYRGFYGDNGKMEKLKTA